MRNISPRTQVLFRSAVVWEVSPVTSRRELSPAGAIAEASHEPLSLMQRSAGFSEIPGCESRRVYRSSVNHETSHHRQWTHQRQVLGS